MDALPLAAWYRAHGRHDLPWRHTMDPWHILVSEFMLHQTQVSRVIEYWTPFVTQWPTPKTFAEAPLPDILRAWKGLGYPRRARNLQDAATHIWQQGWPENESGLLALPGIGTYTARAMRILAWNDGACQLPLDVNIARVFWRLTATAGEVETTGWSMSRRELVYALFDLGSLICRARTPLCPQCPLSSSCTAFGTGMDSAPLLRKRQAPYRGSFRELRSAVLALCLADSTLSIAALEKRSVHILGRAPERNEIERALRSLAADGLLQMTLTEDHPL